MLYLFITRIHIAPLQGLLRRWEPMAHFPPEVRNHGTFPPEVGNHSIHPTRCGKPWHPSHQRWNPWHPSHQMWETHDILPQNGTHTNFWPSKMHSVPQKSNFEMYTSILTIYLFLDGFINAILKTFFKYCLLFSFFLNFFSSYT